MPPSLRRCGRRLSKRVCCRGSPLLRLMPLGCRSFLEAAPPLLQWQSMRSRGCSSGTSSRKGRPEMWHLEFGVSDGNFLRGQTPTVAGTEDARVRKICKAAKMNTRGVARPPPPDPDPFRWFSPPHAAAPPPRSGSLAPGLPPPLAFEASRGLARASWRVPPPRASTSTANCDPAQRPPPATASTVATTSANPYSSNANELTGSIY
ncbi:hypothetical protein U9M48_037478 [Paspalum notatum var. saurae]|uniref:Uncharacterized protein n=1 Tax=Paspalum notatum var. saurae TaxID=547442 RepID=A0AAQ3XCG0_PASNO